MSTHHEPEKYDIGPYLQGVRSRIGARRGGLRGEEVANLIFTCLQMGLSSQAQSFYAENRSLFDTEVVRELDQVVHDFKQDHPDSWDLFGLDGICKLAHATADAAAKQSTAQEIHNQLQLVAFEHRLRAQNVMFWNLMKAQDLEDLIRLLMAGTQYRDILERADVIIGELRDLYKTGSAEDRILSAHAQACYAASLHGVRLSGRILGSAWRDCAACGPDIIENHFVFSFPLLTYYVDHPSEMLSPGGAKKELLDFLGEISGEIPSLLQDEAILHYCKVMLAQAYGHFSFVQQALSGKLAEARSLVQLLNRYQSEIYMLLRLIAAHFSLVSV